MRPTRALCKRADEYIFSFHFLFNFVFWDRYEVFIPACIKPRTLAAIFWTMSGLRTIIIYGLTRQKQIDFIKRRDSSYSRTNFTGLSDKQVIEIALSVDRKLQADRQAKKLPALWTTFSTADND